jgi:dolichol-phosphate mannosyltransferase
MGVPYDRVQRRRGKSSFALGSLLGLAIDGIVSHSILPLRFASFFGLSLSVAAMLAVLVYFVLWISSDRDWPAGFITLAIFMLMSLAINAILLGIIGEYLARIYRQVRPGPLTIVDDYVDSASLEADVPMPRKSHVVTEIVLPGCRADGEDEREGRRDGL